MPNYKVKCRRGVIEAWAQNQTARTSNKALRTSEGYLWSYGLMIGFTSQGGIKVAGDYTAAGRFASQTTSTHVGLAKQVADEITHPEVFETMTPEYY